MYDKCVQYWQENIHAMTIQEERVTVVHDIPAHGRVRLDTEQIYPSEVREIVVPDVVHVVELDQIIAARPRLKAPNPPERDSNVVEVTDFTPQ